MPKLLVEYPANLTGQTARYRVVLAARDGGSETIYKTSTVDQFDPAGTITLANAFTNGLYYSVLAEVGTTGTYRVEYLTLTATKTSCRVYLYDVQTSRIIATSSEFGLSAGDEVACVATLTATERTTLAGVINSALSTSHGAGQWGSSVPATIEQEPVSEAYTFHFDYRGEGVLRSRNEIKIPVGAGPRVAFDFSALLGVGTRLASITSVSVVGGGTGVTLAQLGIDHKQAKVRITGVTASPLTPVPTPYVVTCTVVTTAGDTEVAHGVVWVEAVS